MNPLTDREKTAHLLRRFGLGASEAEIDFYSEGGWEAAVERLLGFAERGWEFDVDPMAFANRQNTVNLRVMQGIWMLRLLATQNPLEEKLTLFWHHHFATSAQKVENSFVMHRHIQVLRQNCLGRFDDLLLAISKDPAMLYWLDNHENVAGKPNENFAREVMELFALGIGRYTEKDVQEAARAFTGWAYGRPFRPNPGAPRRPDEFVYVPERHDDGEKVILGERGPWNGDDVARILCAKPEASLWIARRMWLFFAGSEPKAAVLERLAAAFRSSGLSIRALVRAMMRDPEFYSADVVGRQVKNPVDFVVGTARQLGAGVRVMERVSAAIAEPQVNQENGINQALVRAMGPCFACLQASSSMGMELLKPPDVSGWPLGSAWISSATMVERVKWADRLFAGSAPAGARMNLGGDAGGQRGAAVGASAAAIAGSTATGAELAGALNSLFDAGLPGAKLASVAAAADSVLAGSEATPAVLGDAARAASRVLFGAPEFQFC